MKTQILSFANLRCLLLSFANRCRRDCHMFLMGQIGILVLLMFAVPAQAQNNASLVSQNVPTSMIAGHNYTASFTMKNTGATTWPAYSFYRLGSQNPHDNMVWIVQRVVLDSTVAPGEQVQISFSFYAPRTAGTYNFQWRMLQEGVEWFGELTNNVAITVVEGTPVDDAVFLNQDVMSTMQAGRSYFVSVTVLNIGTTTWKPENNIKLGSQSPHDNLNWGLSRVNVSRPVAPWEQYTFHFTISAPPAAGTVNFQWRMLRENVAWFGAPSFNREISVTAPQVSSEIITFFHSDIANTPMIATDVRGNVVWKENYRPFGERINKPAAGNKNKQWYAGKPYDNESGLTYMGARYYDPMVGRFLGMDPVGFDVNNIHSFNRYSYANNSPYRFVDPDGRSAVAIAASASVLVVGGWIYASNSQARATMDRALRGIANAFRSDSIDSGNSDVGGANSAPPVPGDLVGDQSDPRAGPGSSGKRHTSGPLTPENGGTGDAGKDFDKLTGGTGHPFPGSDGRSKIPGAQVGDNGVWIRPGTKNPGDGPRIEIPGNGNKLPETLHY